MKEATEHRSLKRTTRRIAEERGWKQTATAMEKQSCQVWENERNKKEMQEKEGESGNVELICLIRGERNNWNEGKVRS